MLIIIRLVSQKSKKIYVNYILDQIIIWTNILVTSIKI